MNIININDYICIATLALCKYPVALLAFTTNSVRTNVWFFTVILCPSPIPSAHVSGTSPHLLTKVSVIFLVLRNVYMYMMKYDLI